MKLANFKQQTAESITDYLKRAVNLVTILHNMALDIGMATLEHQEWIKQGCYWTEDVTLTSVSKLVKVTYTNICQLDPFDSAVRHTPKLKTDTNSIQI